MKKRDFLLIGIFLTMTILSVLNIFVKIFSNYTLFIFILILIGVSSTIFGIQEHKSIIEKDIILSIIVYLIFYYVITYIIGFFIGFTKNIYGTHINTIIKNILPIIITIPVIEFLRYILNTRANKKTPYIILSYIAFTLISITIITNNLITTSITNVNSIIEQLGLFIFPIIVTNILTTYLSINVGYHSAIVYRLLMELPPYILPIFPKFGNYIDSVLRISIPIFILLYIYRKIKENEIKKIIILDKKKHLSLSRLLLFAFSVTIVYFICGLFRFHALVIATGSMQPTINIGDIVIIDKKNNISKDKKIKKEYKEGEVITYQKDNSLICHRIIKVKRSGDNVLYETKGDNNDTPDQLLVEQDKVLGVVRYKIKYLGYPTVVLNKYR